MRQESLSSISQSYHESGNDLIANHLHMCTTANALRIASNRHAIYECLGAIDVFTLALKLKKLLETLRKSLLRNQKGGCLTSEIRNISEMTRDDYNIT